MDQTFDASHLPDFTGPWAIFTVSGDSEYTPIASGSTREEFDAWKAKVA